MSVTNYSIYSMGFHGMTQTKNFFNSARYLTYHLNLSNVKVTCNHVKNIN